MRAKSINELRNAARKLIRELGMLQLNASQSNRAPQHWHALIEIANKPNITSAELGRMLLLTPSTMSRVIAVLAKDNLITLQKGRDKREKFLTITSAGLHELKIIDDYSENKIKGALEYLDENAQANIIQALYTYAGALEKSRILREQTKIHTLSTSRTIRKQIMEMIRNIQVNEYHLPVTDEINISILKAEEEFYFNNSYNFWYATDQHGHVIGSIGLKQLGRHEAEIKKFFVDKHYRGKGIARKLLQTLSKACSKHGFESIYLGTAAPYLAAHRFYEKYGFLPIKTTQLPATFIKCPVDTVFFKASCKQIQDRIAGELEL